MANKRKRSRKEKRAIHAKKRAKKFSIWAYQNEDEYRRKHPKRGEVNWASAKEERKKIPKGGHFLPEF